VKGRTAGQIFAVAALVDATGTGLAGVCLPFFVVRVLHGTPGIAAAALSLYGAAECLTAPFAGTLAARVGVARYLIGTRLVAAAAFSAMAFTSSTFLYLSLMVLGGMSTAGSAGVNQVFVADIVGQEDRSRTLGLVRTVRNVGYLVSAGLAAVLLVGGSATALRVALAVNALSFVFRAVCYAYLARGRSGGEVTTELTSPFGALTDRPYVALMLSNFVYVTSVIVLDLGVPLWLLRNGKPTYLAAVVVAINTIAVVAFQVKISAALSTINRARIGLRWATIAFVLMCVSFAASEAVGGAASIAFLVVATLLLTAGEMLESPSWWTLSFDLAPQSVRAKYMATFDMGASLTTVIGPSLIVTVISYGPMGWLAFACLFMGAFAMATLAVDMLMKKALEEVP
jgi:MFS family permease